MLLPTKAWQHPLILVGDQQPMTVGWYQIIIDDYYQAKHSSIKDRLSAALILLHEYDR